MNPRSTRLDYLQSQYPLVAISLSPRQINSLWRQRRVQWTLDLMRQRSLPPRLLSMSPSVAQAPRSQRWPAQFSSAPLDPWLDDSLPPPPPFVPRRLEDFDTGGFIAEGTYGEVFRGKRKGERSGRQLAIKKVKIVQQSDGFPLTAIREIRYLKAMACEDVIDLQEVVTDAHHDAYLVFPLMDHDLAALMKKIMASLVLRRGTRRPLYRSLVTCLRCVFFLVHFHFHSRSLTMCALSASWLTRLRVSLLQADKMPMVQKKYYMYHLLSRLGLPPPRPNHPP